MRSVFVTSWDWLASFWLLCSLAIPGSAQSWAVPTAAGRLRLERAPGSAWPAAAGTVEVWPGPTDAGYLSIYTADGVQVNTQTYWPASEDPAKLLFNTSSGKTVYYLYFDKNPAPPLAAWKPDVGLLLETRGSKNLPCNTWTQFRALLKSSTAAYGRCYVPNIFQGINPLGPSTYYLAFYNGFFVAPQAGEYGFATVSDDASYLSIDGRLVAEWLGRHGPGGGRQGEHSGKIVLGAGKHRIEYVHAQYDGPPAAVAAWKPPGRNRFEVMPASAFEPVTAFQATLFETPPAGKETVYLEWQNDAHCLVDNLGVYLVRFQVLADHPRAYQWTFDDGVTEKGARTQHLFLTPGRRQITLEAWERNNRVASLKSTIEVHPHWAQREEWRQDLYEQAKRELLVRDLSSLTNIDLLAIVELADRVEDAELLNHAGAFFLKRHQEFSAAAHAVVYYKLGLAFQHRGDRGNQQAEQSMRAAQTLARGNPKLYEKARLRLAELLIHSQGKLDEATALLNPTPSTVLNDDEKRLARLLWGDLYAAQGKLEEARKVYEAVSVGPSKAGDNTEIRRRARLESASLFFHRGDVAAAEQILDQIQIENPTDRLSLETQLPLLNIYLGRKEFQRAFTTGQRLLIANEGKPHEAELLLAVAEAGFAAGQKATAQAAVAKLLRDYPYSESAARAKEKWSASMVRQFKQ